MPDRNLSKGMEGADVVDLQRKLERVGLPVTGEQGRFGSATEGAIRRFQEQHQLPVTGVLDDRSKAVIDAVVGVPPVVDHVPPIVVDHVPPIVVDNPPPATTAAIVAGTISFESGLPYALARVRAVDRTIRQETTLADGAADGNG